MDCFLRAVDEASLNLRHLELQVDVVLQKQQVMALCQRLGLLLGLLLEQLG
jgi:hypothetical protein